MDLLHKRHACAVRGCRRCGAGWLGCRRRRVQRNAEPAGRTPAGFTLQVKIAAVQLDKMVGDPQPQADMAHTIAAFWLIHHQALLDLRQPLRLDAPSSILHLDHKVRRTRRDGHHNLTAP